MTKKRPRSQPRILGVVREDKHTKVHPFIEEGLQMISEMEKKSVSWVIAEIVGDFLGVNAATGEILSINQYTRAFYSTKKKEKSA